MKCCTTMLAAAINIIGCVEVNLRSKIYVLFARNAQDAEAYKYEADGQIWQVGDICVGQNAVCSMVDSIHAALQSTVPDIIPAEAD